MDAAKINSTQGNNTNKYIAHKKLNYYEKNDYVWGLYL